MDSTEDDAAGSLFHMSQFIEQFMVQMLVPLSVLYLLIAHNFAAAANVLSVPRPFNCTFAVIFASAQLISMMPIAVIITWCMRGPMNEDEDGNTAVLRIDVIAIIAIYTMHRLAISIKYAFQPKEMYARRMSLWVTYQERLDDQLFASWFKLTRVTIEREVRAAVDTLAEDEASAAFTLPREFLLQLRMGLHTEAQVSLDDDATTNVTSTNLCKLPASVLATALLAHVNEATSGYVLMLQRATSVTGLISMFSSTILRAAQGLPILGSTPLETCTILSAWISNFLLLPTVFTFLSVGIVDHARRELALDYLSRLCRPSPLRVGRGSSAVGMLAEAVKLPTLSLDSVSNVRAFLSTRSLLLSFGKGFHSRLVTVISADILVIIAVAAFCVYTSLTVSIAKSKSALFAPLVLHHALVMPAITLCVLGLFMAARANTAAAQGATVIAQARLLYRLRSREEELDPLLIATLSDVESLLRDNLVPITMFGVAATPALTNALLGAFFSLETVLVSGAATRLSGATGGGQQQTQTTTPSPTFSPSPTPIVSVVVVTSTSSAAGFDVASTLAVGYFLAALVIAIVAAALIVVLLRKCYKPSAAGGTNITTIGDTVEPSSSSSVINPMAKKTLTVLPIWIQQSDDDGDVWWENTKTGMTQWEKPTGHGGVK